MFRPIRSFLREPLLHFVLIGSALFLYFDFVASGDNEALSAKRIIVSGAQVDQLAGSFERTWSRAPTRHELDAMVENHVREEVFYREALAMGLDQDDPMVRRRMRMKLEFMIQDLSAQHASDDALGNFLRQNPDRFREELQLTFRQVYLNPDHRPDLEGDAGRLLALLGDGSAPQALGDQTLIPRDYRLASEREIARGFGDDFARQIASLPVGDWNGPIDSPFGAHLVKVDARIEARVPELAEIRDEVLREYLAENRQRQKDLAYQNFRKGYEVMIAGPNAGASPALSMAEAGEIR